MISWSSSLMKHFQVTYCKSGRESTGRRTNHTEGPHTEIQSASNMWYEIKWELPRRYTLLSPIVYELMTLFIKKLLHLFFVLYVHSRKHKIHHWCPIDELNYYVMFHYRDNHKHYT